MRFFVYPFVGLTLFGALGTAAAENSDQKDGEPEQLSPIQVTGEAYSGAGTTQGYAATSASTATRSRAPIVDTPASVQVVPRDIIEDQQADSVEQTLRNVSGIVFSDGGEGVSVSARGLDASILQDGFAATELFSTGGTGRTALDTFNIARVEVLKGPAGVLYGRGNPGATINLVTKKPLAEARGSFGLRADSEGAQRYTLDMGGPLTDGALLSYRFNALIEDQQSFRDRVDGRTYALAPSLRWDIAPDTRLLIEAEVADVEQVPDGGVPGLDGDVYPGVDPDVFLGEPGDEINEDRQALRVMLTRDVGADWQWRTSVRAQYRESAIAFTRPARVNADGRTASRAFIDSTNDSEDYQLQTELTGTLALAGMTHNIVVGSDIEQRDIDNGFAAFQATDIDIFNPVYGSEPGNQLFAVASTNDRHAFGLFAQDRIDLSPAWILSLGGRYDYLSEDIRDGGVGNLEQQPGKRDSEFSPNVGLVYQPTETLSFYGRWSEGFRSVPGAPVTAEGEALDPETSKIYELGSKLSLADGRLIGTAAVFRATRDNAVQPDPGNPGFQTNLGETRSEGVELDISGELLPGWRLLAAYAFTDATIRDAANPDNIGNRVSNIPRHSGRLWTTYEFASGPWSGLGFSAGVYTVSSRPVTLANDVSLPGYATVDAGIFYEQPGYTARLNVKNLLDEEDNVLGPKRREFVRNEGSARLIGSLELRF